MSSTKPLPGYCGARLQNKPGEFCMFRPIKTSAKRRCRKHGGTQLTGIASPSYINGSSCDKYRNLPSRIAGQYIDAQKDPDLLSARNDIALCDARLADLIRRVDAGGGSAIWATLRKADEAKDEAFKSDDQDAFKKCLQSMSLTIKRGAADYAVWADIMDTIERRRKLSETEHKRLVAMQQMITGEQAGLMIGAVSGMVKSGAEKFITAKEDRKAFLSYVANEMRIIAHGRPT